MVAVVGGQDQGGGVAVLGADAVGEGGVQFPGVWPVNRGGVVEGSVLEDGVGFCDRVVLDGCGVGFGFGGADVLVVAFEDEEAAAVAGFPVGGAGVTAWRILEDALEPVGSAVRWSGGGCFVQGEECFGHGWPAGWDDTGDTNDTSNLKWPSRGRVCACVRPRVKAINTKVVSLVSSD